MAIPLIPIVVGLVVAGGGVVAYLVLRPRAHLSPSELALLPTLTAAQMEAMQLGGTLTQAKPTLTQAKPTLQAAVPERFPKAATPQDPSLPAPTAEDFAKRYTAMYMSTGKCVEWRWGFAVRELMDDLLDAGGAQAVTSLMGLISNFTGIDTLLERLNVLIKFKLIKHELSPQGDGQGTGTYLVLSAYEPVRDYIPPAVPLPKVEGYTRVWVRKKMANVGEIPAYTVVQPHRLGAKWSWLVTTTELRTALREDKINISTIRGAQCGDGSWRLVSKAKAREYYR